MSAQDMRDKNCPDPAMKNAFLPSGHSLNQSTSPKSDLGGADYPNL